MMFPRDMVCLRNISVDTLHKRDTDDDADDDDDDDNNNNISSNSDSIEDSRKEGLGKYISSKSQSQSRRDFNSRTSQKPFHMHMGSAADPRYSINPSVQ